MYQFVPTAIISYVGVAWRPCIVQRATVPEDGAYAMRSLTPSRSKSPTAPELPFSNRGSRERVEAIDRAPVHVPHGAKTHALVPPKDIRHVVIVEISDALGTPSAGTDGTCERPDERPVGGHQPLRDSTVARAIPQQIIDAVGVEIANTAQFPFGRHDPVASCTGDHPGDAQVPHDQFAR